MWDVNAVPWTTDELITFGCLVVSTVMVTTFPVVYGIRAELRDQLARIVVLATSATSLAFITAVVFVLMHHAAVEVNDVWRHWIARLIYLTVGVGKLAMLWAVFRTPPLPASDT